MYVFTLLYRFYGDQPLNQRTDNIRRMPLPFGEGQGHWPAGSNTGGPLSIIPRPVTIGRALRVLYVFTSI